MCQPLGLEFSTRRFTSPHNHYPGGDLLFPFSEEELGAQGHTSSKTEIQIPPKLT